MGNCAAKSDPYAVCQDKDGNDIRAGDFLMAEYTGYGDNRVSGDGKYVAGMVNPKKQTLAYRLRDPTNVPTMTARPLRPPDLAGKSPCDEWVVKYSKGHMARIGRAQPAPPTSVYRNLEEAITVAEACVDKKDYAGATEILEDALQKCHNQEEGFNYEAVGGRSVHKEKVALLNAFLKKARGEKVRAQNADKRKQRHAGREGGGRSKKKRTKNKRTKNKRTKRTKNKRKNRTYKNKGR